MRHFSSYSIWLRWQRATRSTRQPKIYLSLSPASARRSSSWKVNWAFPCWNAAAGASPSPAAAQNFLHDAYSLIKQFHTMQDHYLQTEPQGMITMSITSRYYIFVAKAVAKWQILLKEHNYFIRLPGGKRSAISFRMWQPVGVSLALYPTMIPTQSLFSMSLSAFNLEFPQSAATTPRFSVQEPPCLPKNPNITPLHAHSPYPYIFYDGGNDPYGYTEEVFFPVHPQKSIAVSDRSSMLNIIRHSECYNLGSGWLLEGYSESDLITRPLSLPADTTMQVGWITKTRIYAGCRM